MVRAVEAAQPRMILHLGDCWRDAEELHDLFPSIPMEQVPGNCDLGRREAQERIIFIEDKRVLLAHGHTMHVKYGLLSAQYRAREMQSDILLFGHTHQPLIDLDCDLMMLNPGAIGDCRRPTYGTLTFENGQCTPAVHLLE